MKSVVETLKSTEKVIPTLLPLNPYATTLYHDDTNVGIAR